MYWRCLVQEFIYNGCILLAREEDGLWSFHDKSGEPLGRIRPRVRVDSPYQAYLAMLLVRSLVEESLNRSLSLEYGEQDSGNRMNINHLERCFIL